MAQTERGLAQDLYAALAAADRTALARLLHPAFVGETTAGLPLGLGGRYEGPDSMRRDFWWPLGRAFAVVARPASFHRLDDGQLLVTGRYVGTVRDTGVPLDAAFTHTMAFRDGQIAGIVQLTDSQLWARALATPAPVDTVPVDTVPSDTVPSDTAALSTLIYSVRDGVARIHLNRPQSANALNVEAARELLVAARACTADPAVRVVLITGEGKRFCAGGDIGLFAGTAPEALPALLDAMIEDYHQALILLTELPVPVVCAVQGAAAGGGMGLVYVADLVVAAADAKFALGYGALGLSADGANTWFLPRLVGPARAASLFLLNTVMSAPEALTAGLVAEVVPPDQLADRGAQLAAQLAAGPTRAFGIMRSLLRGSSTTTLADQLHRERKTIVEAAGTRDAAEGIAAFTAKRPPAFEGR